MNTPISRALALFVFSFPLTARSLCAQKVPDRPPQAAPAAQPQRPAPPVMVKEVLVKFHTNDDDKDRDTKLTTDFMCHDSVFASSNIKPTSSLTCTSFAPFFTLYNDSFSDNRDTPWINVGVSNTVAKAAIHSCQTKIRIDPNGHDTWKFNYWVKLIYTDGSHDEYHYDGHALSEKERENIFNLN